MSTTVSAVPSNINIALFADDCMLYTPVRSIPDQHVLNGALNSLLLWCKDYGMELNTDKTVLLRITKKKKPFLFTYNVQDTPVTEVSKYKYLGLTINSQLKWNDHIQYITSSALRKLGLLRHKLKGTPANVKLLAYNSIIRPKLEYAAIVWDPHTAKDIKEIEKVQRRAVRFIYNKYKRTDSPTNLMTTNQIKPLHLRRKIARLSFLHSLIHGKLGISATPLVSPLETRRTRHHHSYALTPYPARTNLFKFSYFPKTITEWNNLPETVISAKDFENALHLLFNQ